VSVIRYTPLRPFVIRMNDTGAGVPGPAAESAAGQAGTANGQAAGRSGVSDGDAVIGGGAGG
jgi:hypothetical protein